MAKITARFIIEIAGKPVENVQKALEKFKEQFEKEKVAFKLTDIDLAKPELNEESKLFTGFIDLETKFDDINKLLGFIIDYTPTSVEIMEPSDIKFDSAELSATLNDMSAAILKTNIELMKYKQAAGQMYRELESLKKK